MNPCILRFFGDVGIDIANHLRGKFASCEIPRRFHLVLGDFTVANGLLTQTLKLKRRAVMERFAGITAAAAEAPPPGRALHPRIPDLTPTRPLAYSSIDVELSKR